MFFQSKFILGFHKIKALVFMTKCALTLADSLIEFTPHARELLLGVLLENRAEQNSFTHNLNNTSCRIYVTIISRIFEA